MGIGIPTLSFDVQRLDKILSVIRGDHNKLESNIEKIPGSWVSDGLLNFTNPKTDKNGSRVIKI